MLKRYGDLAKSRVVANLAGITDPTQQQQWKLILTNLEGIQSSLALPAGPKAQ
jgi:hypothetical protein